MLSGSLPYILGRCGYPLQKLKQVDRDTFNSAIWTMTLNNLDFGRRYLSNLMKNKQLHEK